MADSNYTIILRFSLQPVVSGLPEMQSFIFVVPDSVRFAPKDSLFGSSFS